MAGAISTNEANFFQLQGGDVSVAYSATSFSGQPIFNYHDGTVSRQFTGTEIEVEDCLVGTLVTVTLSIVPDLATTLFSLLVPAVTLPSDGTNEPVKTIGFTTIKKMNFFGHPVGQIDGYKVQDLDGTARFIVS